MILFFMFKSSLMLPKALVYNFLLSILRLSVPIASFTWT